MAVISRTVSIYVGTHGRSNTAYVGSGLDAEKRVHKHLAGKGPRSTKKWIKELAPDKPRFKVVDTCDEADRALVESAWIVHYAVIRGYEMINRAWQQWPLDFSEIGVLGGKASMAEKNAEGKSIHAIKMGKAGNLTLYAEKNSEGKSSHAVKMAEKGAVAGAFASHEVQRRKSSGIFNHEFVRKMGRKGGLKGGASRFGRHRRQASMAGKSGCHTRYHLARAIINSNCEFCANPEPEWVVSASGIEVQIGSRVD